MVIGMSLFGENSFGWRFGSAVMGVICILGIYQLVFAVFGKKIALLAALLLSIEGLHVSQSRVGMNDMYMLAFLIWSLYNAVKGKWKLTAILFGLSLASKWSAVYGVIPLALVYLHDNWPNHNYLGFALRCMLFALRMLLIAAIVYVLTFIPFLTAGHTWAQWWELHRQMWYYHTHLVATHAFQSTPYQWIFSLRPVWYFVEYGEKISNIYAQGNPAILWLGLAALLLLLPRILRFRYSLFFILYAVFTLPWLFSPGSCSLSHLPSATFLSVIFAAWLAELPRRTTVFIHSLPLCISHLPVSRLPRTTLY
jgi:dolichyl-phosphate-mannose--protein O-mannosyl transferase